MPSSDATSRAAASGTRRRVFTPREANLALPLVRRIVADVVEQYRELLALAQQYERQPSPELKDEIHTIDDRLRDLIEEIGDIGVQLKDLEVGLVDFPARANGHDILLCWKLGEPAVAFWHDCNAGFAGRQSIPEHFAASERSA